MEFKLPDIGEGVVEGELIQWLVKEGDVVKADQPVIEVMTDKATVEVPTPVGGKISKLTAKEGQMIKVGQTLAQIEEGAAGAAKAPEAPAKAAEKTAPESKSETPVRNASGEGTDTTKAATASKSAEVPQNKGPSSSPTGAYAGNVSLSPSQAPAAPIVRAMAAKSGVDLGSVTGSGPKIGGSSRVLEEDLLRHLKGNQSQAANGNGNHGTSVGYAQPAKAAKSIKAIPDFMKRNLSEGAPHEEVRTPMRGLRRVIANAMVKSKFTAPHYSYVDEFECSELVEIREKAKIVGEEYGIKVSYLPFIVKALVGALKEFPVANSSLEETPDGLVLVQKKYYHIGIAVATNDGLVVPVIRDADRKSLLQIAQEINDLSAKTRAGKATAEELKGSTFTITSMGNIGGLFATPIINYPEVGIMGVYKVQEKPIVQDGQIVIGKTMHLSLSLDHRVVDGAVGGYFCNAVIERLSNPAKLLMEMI